MNTQIKFKKLREGAILPTKATVGSAAFDLYRCDEKGRDSEHAILFPGEKKEYGTGLAVEVPEGWVMLIFSRSGHGFKNQIRLSNCVGVIDSDYRGEVKVALKSDVGESRIDYGTNVGDRIAQAIFMPLPVVELVWAEELSDTERGEGGFGSTNVAPRGNPREPLEWYE